MQIVGAGWNHLSSAPASLYHSLAEILFFFGVRSSRSRLIIASNFSVRRGGEPRGERIHTPSHAKPINLPSKGTSAPSAVVHMFWLMA